MNIQLQQLGIYSRDLKEYKFISFQKGKLNIIHGASQTGKSAIIPIIDYCLCSSHNRIPKGIISNSCSAYAINLSIDDKNLLIKRFSGEKYKIIHYALVSKNLDEIEDSEWQITDIDKFKIYLNNLFGVSFSEIVDDSEKNKGNPSFRDLVAFNFQSQSIVANPNCLLYKMDLAEYRFYLRRIFDYAIGAMTSEQLYAGLKKQELMEKLKELQRQKSRHETYIQRKIETVEPLLYKAIEYGLIPQTEINITDTVNIEILLKQISEKNIGDIKFSNEANEIIANKIQDLINQLDSLHFEVRALKQERNNIEELLGIEEQNRKQLNEKCSRLEIAEFIRDFCKANSSDTIVIDDVENLYNNLKIVQDKLIDANILGKGVYEAKLNRLRKQINEKTEKINILSKNKDILEGKIGTQSFIQDLYVKIIGGAQKIINEISEKNDINQQIEELNSEIAKYDFDIDELRQKQLTSIVNKSNSYVPDFAEFDEIASFSKEDLTVKVKNKYSSESYFLWETGSGSNWVAYHIAIMLGLHKHFLYKKTPVFNFIIFDQPSQVYFPKVNYQHTKDFDFDNDKKSDDIDKGFSDLECVQEMFKIMCKAIDDNKSKKTVTKVAKDGTSYQIEEISDSNLQIIVLDHAGPDVWQNLGDINDINPLEEWTLENRLVPENWISG